MRDSGEDIRDAIEEFRPEQSVGYLLRVTSRAFTSAFKEVLAQEGVTIGIWFYLRALWEEDGLTQADLSQRVETMAPSTGLALGKMEQQGLIRRKVDVADRRKRYVFLTSKGKKMRRRLVRCAAELNSEITRDLSSGEQIVLRAALEKLRARLRQNRFGES